MAVMHTPFGMADRTKKRRKRGRTVIQDVDVERFSDLVFTSSQPKPRAKGVLCKHRPPVTKREEEPEQERSEAISLVQGGCEKHAAGEDLDLLPVAPNMEAGGSHLQETLSELRSGPETCERSAEWSSSWCVGKGNST